MNGNELHRKVCALWLAMWAIAAASAAAAAPSSGPAAKPAPAKAAQPASKPATRPAGKVVFPLARAAPQPLRKYTLDELAAMFPDFKHAPFDSAGYNHFSLPIHYEDRSGDGDANEAMAMSHLLSYALDWGDGCYCSRHAYFIFKRSAEDMPALMKKYDPKLVSALVRDWGASHGVGGKLIRLKNGYAGELTIFDRDGKVVKEVRYEKPREFFELLGDMSVDGITFLSGSAPTPELAKHLHAKQCKDRQSLIDLGKAAFVEERSDEEWAIYDGILKRDPGFASVRYWRANQKSWQDRDEQAKSLEMARSLDSYITKMAIENLDAGLCPDKDLAAKAPQWMRQAEDMAGKDSMFCLQRQVGQAIRNKKISPEMRKKAVEAGRKYPNDYTYLLTLSRSFDVGYDLPVDAEMAQSILIAALRNDYLPGSGWKGDAIRRTSVVTCSLGLYDLCVDILTPYARANLDKNSVNSVAWDAQMLGEALYEMGRFDESWKWHRVAFLNRPEGSEEAVKALIGGASAAAHAGRRDIVEQILRDRRGMLERKKAVGLVQGYLDVMDGKPLDEKSLWIVKVPGDRWLRDYMMTLQVEAEILHNVGDRMQSLMEKDFAQWEPQRRSFLILCHEVFRQRPEKAPDSFYHMISRMRPDDPWVRSAVAEWKKWDKPSNLPDPARIMEELKDYPPIEWRVADPAQGSKAGNLFYKHPIGTFDSAILQLIERGKLNEAQELSQRYMHLATDCRHFCVKADAGTLFRRVEQARKAKRGAVSPDNL
jgi:hypothetical protein